MPQNERISEKLYSAEVQGPEVKHVFGVRANIRYLTLEMEQGETSPQDRSRMQSEGRAAAQAE